MRGVTSARACICVEEALSRGYCYLWGCTLWGCILLLLRAPGLELGQPVHDGAHLRKGVHEALRRRLLGPQLGRGGCAPRLHGRCRAVEPEDGVCRCEEEAPDCWFILLLRGGGARAEQTTSWPSESVKVTTPPRALGWMTDARPAPRRFPGWRAWPLFRADSGFSVAFGPSITTEARGALFGVTSSFRTASEEPPSPTPPLPGPGPSSRGSLTDARFPLRDPASPAASSGLLTDFLPPPSRARRPGAPPSVPLAPSLPFSSPPMRGFFLVDVTTTTDFRAATFWASPWASGRFQAPRRRALPPYRL